MGEDSRIWTVARATDASVKDQPSLRTIIDWSYPQLGTVLPEWFNVISYTDYPFSMRPWADRIVSLTLGSNVSTTVLFPNCVSLSIVQIESSILDLICFPKLKKLSLFSLDDLVVRGDTSKLERVFISGFNVPPELAMVVTDTNRPCLDQLYPRLETLWDAYDLHFWHIPKMTKLYCELSVFREAQSMGMSLERLQVLHLNLGKTYTNAFDRLQTLTNLEQLTLVDTFTNNNNSRRVTLPTWLVKMKKLRKLGTNQDVANWEFIPDHLGSITELFFPSLTNYQLSTRISDTWHPLIRRLTARDVVGFPEEEPLYIR